LERLTATANSLAGNAYGDCHRPRLTAAIGADRLPPTAYGIC